jgi:streptogrisin C
MRHSRGASAGSALAIGALVMTVLPVAAEAAAPSPAGAPAAIITGDAGQDAGRSPAGALPAGALKAMQRDLGITAEQARERVANEYRAGKIAPLLAKDLADSYAGAWTTGDTSTLVVATTDASDARRISAKGARAKVVEHTLAELGATKEALDHAARHGAPTSVSQWYADVRTNSVVVRASDTAKARAFAETAGAGSDLVRVVKSAEKPRPYAELRGGDAYYINDTSRCSVGFAVTDGTLQGFVTAGHCGVPGDTTAGHDRSAQGVFQGSSFPGDDYGWVATADGWTATPYVKGSGGADVTVAGSAQAPVGSSVCRSGSTTGWHCGTIEQHGVTVQYGQGDVHGLTRTTVCAEPGDSGGPYITGDQAQGVTSGGSGNCTTGGTTFYQPVEPVLEAYGLTLVTG